MALWTHSDPAGTSLRTLQERSENTRLEVASAKVRPATTVKIPAEIASALVRVGRVFVKVCA